MLEPAGVSTGDATARRRPSCNLMRPVARCCNQRTPLLEPESVFAGTSASIGAVEPSMLHQVAAPAMRGAATGGDGRRGAAEDAGRDAEEGVV